jgi:hypothetical protein
MQPNKWTEVPGFKDLTKEFYNFTRDTQITSEVPEASWKELCKQNKEQLALVNY